MARALDLALYVGSGALIGFAFAAYANVEPYWLIFFGVLFGLFLRRWNA